MPRRQQNKSKLSWQRLLGLLVLSCVVSGCGLGYVVESTYYQMELLASREPIAEVREQCTMSAWESEAVSTIVDVKRYGQEIGLKGSANYDTIAVGWERQIWNVSGCDPVAFKPETWWFPIVGTVPYLGFFTKEDAQTKLDELAKQDLDVYMRPVGAYSTLGWFEDPILLTMLQWSLFDLANTILHELAHATIWISGSVAFNESFANFVGEIAAFRYLANRYGEDSSEYTNAQKTFEDRQTWRQVLLGVYHDLDTLYGLKLPRSTTLERKAAIFDSLPGRIESAGFHRAKAYLRAVKNRAPWNNAILMQFKTYNANREWFQVIFERNNGDLLAFMRAIAALTEASDDGPYKALQHEAERLKKQ